MKMSKSVFLMLAVTTFLTTQVAHSAPFKGPIKGIKNQALNDVYSGINFQYLDRDDRLLIVNDFLKSVELEYALLPLKVKRIGLDFNKLKSEAIALESTSENILLEGSARTNPSERERISFLQAKSNMDFLDRMHALVALFKDTHFSIDEKITRPLVYTGVRLHRIGGKIIVASLEEKFMAMASRLSGADFSDLKLGNEVIAINGIPVEEKINEYKKFISGSSDEYIDYQAVRALTLRNFRYDQSNSITLTLKKGGVFKLPLFVNRPKDSTPRLDALAFLTKVGVPSDSASIGMVYDPSLKQWNDSALSFRGYNPTLMHLHLKGLTEYKSESGSPALRTGYYISKGKTYGVLQILTFVPKKVTDGESVMSFTDGIRTFVHELKENGIPLILDLRINGGGNGKFPGEVLSILAGKDVVYPGPTMGFRMTSYLRQVEEPDLYQEVVGENQTTGLTTDDLKNLFIKTIEAKREYSPMFSANPVKYDAEKIDGFDNKIVALVTANCISACDMMSFLLKTSKRATIIGTHSNGTGAGYISTGELNTQWEDRLRVLSTQFPNFLFGLPGSTLATVFDDNSVDTMCTENKPTMADITYAPSIQDVAKNNLGWLEKAAEVLDAQK